MRNYAEIVKGIEMKSLLTEMTTEELQALEADLNREILGAWDEDDARVFSRFVLARNAIRIELASR